MYGAARAAKNTTRLSLTTTSSLSSSTQWLYVFRYQQHTCSRCWQDQDSYKPFPGPIQPTKMARQYIWDGLRLLLAVQTGQPIGDPASVYDSALCPQIARLRRALQLPIAVRRALPCVVYRSAHGAAVQAAIWQLGASQSWRANANHCSANNKSLCYLRLPFVEQLNPG